MATQDWNNRKITVLGLSRSGAAVARYVASRGGQVFLSETSPASPQNEPLRRELAALNVLVEMGGHSKQCFTHADLVIASPGIPPASEIMEQLTLSGKTVISEVEFAFREAGEIPLIGITGTNGKSTTTSLIAWILSQAGHDAPACGNIGLPITDVIHRGRPDYLVVELSSFQLALSPSLQAKVGVFTNFQPDHLDWHGSLEAYQEAKLSLFSGERSPEWAVVRAEDPVSKKVAARIQGAIVGFSCRPEPLASFANRAYLDSEGVVTLALEGRTPLRLFPVSELRLIGEHNYENVLAAVATAFVLGVNPEIIAQACRTFDALEHRLEPLPPAGEDAVVFYNDSKATNTDAAISALKAFGERKVVLIAGGYDKMTPLDDFVAAVKRHAARVILIGAARERFSQALEAGGYQAVDFSESLEAAVHNAYRLSGGAPVLFSPACASFDMFRNFEERGRRFKEAVMTLQAPTPTGTGLHG